MTLAADNDSYMLPVTHFVLGRLRSLSRALAKKDKLLPGRSNQWTQ